MRHLFPSSILLALGLASTSLFAQVHFDINISYDDDSSTLVLRDGTPGFGDGNQVFTSNFPVSGFSIRFTENPGFLAAIANGDSLLPGDRLELELLQSGGFGSYLTFYDKVTNEMEPTSATVTINDNSGSTSDLIVANDDLQGDNPLFIQTADSNGEVHSHIDFLLSDDASEGAYGFLFELKTDNDDFSKSHPVWLVFNYGLDSSEFLDMAVPAFAAETFILGDVNRDGIVSLLDVGPFVDLLSSNEFDPAADIDGDGTVSLLDVQPFVELLSS